MKLSGGDGHTHYCDQKLASDIQTKQHIDVGVRPKNDCLDHKKVTQKNLENVKSAIGPGNVDKTVQN